MPDQAKNAPQPSPAPSPSTVTTGVAPGPAVIEVAIPTELDALVKDMHPANRAAVERAVKALLRDADVRQMQGSVALKIDAKIANIDEKLSRGVDAVMHHPKYLAMESTWRGLKFLVEAPTPHPDLKFKVLNARKEDILDDVQAREEAQLRYSLTWKKIFNPFDRFNDHPFACLITDWQIRNNASDIKLLESVGYIGWKAFCPVFANADPDLLGLSSWTEVVNPDQVWRLVDTPAHTRWNAFRKSDASRFVVLDAPRYRGRATYGKGLIESDFAYKEQYDQATHDQLCWIPASFAHGAVVAESYSQYGFCTNIQGPKGGGAIENLPVEMFKTADGRSENKCPIEVNVTMTLEENLSDLGINFLVYKSHDVQAAFFSARTVHDAKQFFQPGANAASEIRTRLATLFAVSRFSHFVKQRLLYEIGLAKSPEQIQRELYEWLNCYVEPSPTATHEDRVRKPLRRADVKTVRYEHHAGAYLATFEVEPHVTTQSVDVKWEISAPAPGGGGAGV